MMPAHLFRLAALLAALGTIPARADPPPPDPDQDWKRRASAPGVVKAVGFDTIQEWARYQWDRHLCLPAYQVVVDGRKAGCRSNAWDTEVKTSGRGALRFDILSRTGANGAGSLAIPFGDYDTAQFGAGEEFWISWRQRLTPRLLQGYAVENDPSRITYFKQIIVSQGDMPGPGGRTIVANSCSESEIVVVSSDPSQGPPRPQAYMECQRYSGFVEALGPDRYAGDARGSGVFSGQNMRRNKLGLATCITFPNFLDRSGCLTYRALEWMTFMIRVKLGPEGTALSSVSGVAQPGFTGSTFELYLAHAGQDFELLHRQKNVVFPRGQYFAGGDPEEPGSYRHGWSPTDAHAKARFGKLWLLPYMTYKDPHQDTEPASTWYDEVIISRCPIAAPGFPAREKCSHSATSP